MIIYSAPESGGCLDSRQFPLRVKHALVAGVVAISSTGIWAGKTQTAGAGCAGAPRAFVSPGRLGETDTSSGTRPPTPQASALQWRPTKGLSKVASPASPILPLPSEQQPRPSEQRMPGRSTHSAEHLLQVGTAPSVLANLPTRECSRLLHHRMKQLKLQEEGTF